MLITELALRWGTGTSGALRRGEGRGAPSRGASEAPRLAHSTQRVRQSTATTDLPHGGCGPSSRPPEVVGRAVF
ncbi:unnamed protein product [Leptosia nina]|uniref:Uncharacterized protein n=1 Tax=Leptosia nina TaxID=320188 RepID=A0AAV1JDT8_9NEOP